MAPSPCFVPVSAALGRPFPILLCQHHETYLEESHAALAVAVLAEDSGHGEKRGEGALCMWVCVRSAGGGVRESLGACHMLLDAGSQGVSVVCMTPRLFQAMPPACRHAHDPWTPRAVRAIAFIAVWDEELRVLLQQPREQARFPNLNWGVAMGRSREEEGHWTKAMAGRGSRTCVARCY